MQRPAATDTAGRPIPTDESNGSSMTETAYILSGARTAIGTFGGSLAGHAPSALGAAVAVEAMKRAAVEPATSFMATSSPLARRTHISPVSRRWRQAFPRKLRP